MFGVYEKRKTGQSEIYSLSLLFVCRSELTEFLAELTEFAQNSVRLSEFSSSKQYSRNSIPPVS